MKSNDTFNQAIKAIQEKDLLKLKKAFVSIPKGSFDFDYWEKLPEIGWFSLMKFAIFYGDKDVLDFLVTQGADCNKPDKAGNPPIINAVYADKMDMVQYFLDLGVDIESTDKNDCSVLTCAAVKGNIETVQFLVERGADVNAHNKFNELFPLMGAVMNEHKDVVEYLLQQGADTEKRMDVYHNSFLWPNPIGDTALMTAASTGDLEMTQLLLEYGADMNARSDEGKNVKELAKMCEHDDIVRVLRKFEKNPKKYQKTIEVRVLSLSDKELTTFPQSQPDLMSRIKKLDLFARIIGVLPYDKQVKFYTAVNSHMKPETKEMIQQMIRDNRLQKGRR